MKNDPNAVTIAYVLEDINCNDAFIIRKGCIFEVDKKDSRVLHGIWKGGTDELEKIHIQYDEYWEGKISYYETDKRCLTCKYCCFHEKYSICDEAYCVQNPDEVEQFYKENGWNEEDDA